ncbi:MAG: threonine--tRNA ligase, partial [Patescibacteria group bacterium]
KRDHRKIGKELDLFTFSDLVGAGLPLFTPKGVIIIDELKKHIEQVCQKYGFKKVLTPHLAKISLYELSGHAKKFSEELFHVSSQRNHEFVIRPVLCPHQTQIYASRPRSYRDLPIRYMESEKQYRAEKPGEVGGLNRVYSITIEDGHIFCRVDQIKQEIKNLVKIVQDFYKPLGMWGKHWVSLSVRDYQHPEKYVGEPKDWDTCEKILKQISNETGLKAKKMEGEAALYGPKLDFMFRDALGKKIQIPTIQLDFATPKRFKLSYIDKNGQPVTPVMIHRAILGSYERFMALLIEHFAGAFPVWLSPVQVQIIPVSEKFNKYGEKVKEQFQAENIRVELNDRNETLGKKIRAGELQKIPYLLIVGEKEQKADLVAVRDRKKGDLGPIKTKTFIERIKKEINSKGTT